MHTSMHLRKLSTSAQHKIILTNRRYLRQSSGLTRPIHFRLRAPHAARRPPACAQKRPQSHTPGIQHESKTDIPPLNEPTIYALSTAPGRAAIAIIRISGPACFQVASHLTQFFLANYGNGESCRFITHYVRASQSQLLAMLLSARSTILSIFYHGNLCLTQELSYFYFHLREQ